MSAGSIERGSVGAVAVLTMNRTAAGNALAGADLTRLAARLRDCLADEKVRVIVLTGAGTKFFCTGSDLKELAGGVADIGLHLRLWHEVVDLLAGSGKPVIAALNGLAVGGGLELALACHRRIAAAHVRVGLPELKVGLFPAAGGVRRLTRLIGAAKALKLVLSAELLDANAASGLGIVDEVFAEPDFEQSALRVAAQLSQFEPNAVAAVLCCARMAALGIDSNDMEVALLRQCYSAPGNRNILEKFLLRQKEKAETRR